MIFFLKSVAWILGTGLAFVGAWWFKFTRDDPTDPGRMILTEPGIWARRVAIALIVVGAILEVVTWRIERADAVVAAADLASQKALAKETADDLKKATTSLNALLDSVGQLRASLVSGSPTKAEEAIDAALDAWASNDPKRLLLLNESDALKHMREQMDREFSKQTNLLNAVEAGDLETVKQLVKGGASLGRQGDLGDSPLHAAARSGDLAIGALLIDAGADINLGTRHGRSSPLMLAVLSGKADFVEMLLKRGALVDLPDETRSTPLIQASFYRRVDLIKTLLAHKADPNLVDDRDETALKQGIYDTGLVAALLEGGADPNVVPPRKGITALFQNFRAMGCPAENRKGVLDLLIAHKAICEVKSVDGATPLMFAIQGNCREDAAKLLGCGANPDCSFPNGKACVEVARDQGYREIVALLEAKAKR